MSLYGLMVSVVEVLEVGPSVGAERGACSVVEVLVVGSSMGVGTCFVVEA